MSLEDEREEIKALKRKHTSSTKDLQRQIAHCKRSDLNTLSLFPSPSFVLLCLPHLCLHSVVCAVSLCGFPCLVYEQENGAPREPGPA